MDDLTNDAKFLITTMYKQYVESRKDNVDKVKATNFGNESDIKNNLMPEWSTSDVHETLAELHKAVFITTIFGDNQFNFIKISTKAISQLEVSFGDKVTTVIDYIAKIKSAIPFIYPYTRQSSDRKSSKLGCHLGVILSSLLCVVTMMMPTIELVG